MNKGTNQDYNKINCLKLKSILQNKMITNLSYGFKALQRSRDYQTNVKNITNCLLLHLKIIVNNKQRFAFNRIKQKNNIVQIIKPTLTLGQKGRTLLKLQKFIKRQMQRVIRNWRFQYGTKSREQLEKASDHLVLYTNVNKTTVFYRLFQMIKKNRQNWPIKTKKSLTIMSIIFNNRINQSLRQSFGKIKLHYGNDSIDILTKTFLQSEKQILFKKCKNTFNSFMILETCIKKSAQDLLFAKIERSKIIWSFMKIIANLKANQKDVLSIWRSATNQSLIKQRYREKQRALTYNTSIYEDTSVHQSSRCKIRISRILQSNISHEFYEQEEQGQEKQDYFD